jgi:pyruvate-ferredoxin/flavodoxin oxidoreductase
LYRFDPRRTEKGENPLQLDSSAPRTKVEEYLLSENRFKMLTQSRPEDARRYFAQAQLDIEKRWERYQKMAAPKIRTPESS